MNKTTKMLAAGMLIAAMGIWTPGTAYADNPDEFTLTVTIGNQLSVRVMNNDGSGDRDNYNFGTMSYGDLSINLDTEKININNDSGGLQQSYQLSVDDDDAGTLTAKIISGSMAADSDMFRVQALFQDDQPGHDDFNDADIVTETAVAATNAAGDVFATGSVPANEDGVAVNDDNRITPYEVRLWLRLELSGLGTESGLQTGFAKVVINAQ